jgi:hypothetical protein
MDLAPEGTRAAEIGFKLNEQTPADGLDQAMGIAVYAQD